MDEAGRPPASRSGLNMSLTNKENVDRVMQGLPPEARAALNVMSQMQQRPPEDVLRD